MNEMQVTLVGYVASAPTLAMTKGGRFVTNMRVGVTPRRLDRLTGQWSDGDTSYLTVSCWRSLASNVAACLRKGDPIVVKGRMRVREFDDKDGNRRLVVEVEALTLGHDLTRGVAHFLRTKRSPGDAPPAEAGRLAGGESALSSAEAWPAGDPLELPAGHDLGDEFAAAELFDGTAIDASSVQLIPGGRATGTDVVAEPPAGGDGAGVDADSERLGKAA
jgi:single-strand DNA-binding protein